MKFIDYLTDRVFTIICCVVSGSLIFGLLWLIEVPIMFIIFLETILVITLVISFIWDYRRRSMYYNQLLQLLNQLDKKTLLTEIVEPPYFLDGQILSNILRQSNKYKNDQIAEMERQSRDYRDYLDTWVHEIKTPITTVRLIVENEKNATTLKIDDELRKINNYVEQVLYYARSTDVEKDFKIEKTTLKTLVNTALKAYSKPLIHIGGKLKMEQLDITVRADTKSCTFIIGQIISNAIKYHQENFCLSFYAYEEKNRVCLTIKDNGVGIAATDLSRVFEKGFTGENGRRYTNSTGIGLYLCKKLCNKMNIELNINSIQGSGTTVIIWFPTESLLREVGI